MLDYKGPMELELALYPVAGIQYATIEKFPVYFVLNKKRPNAQKIIDLLDASYRSSLVDHADENFESGDGLSKRARKEL